MKVLFITGSDFKVNFKYLPTDRCWFEHNLYVSLVGYPHLTHYTIMELADGSDEYHKINEKSYSINRNFKLANSTNSDLISHYNKLIEEHKPEVLLTTFDCNEKYLNVLSNLNVSKVIWYVNECSIDWTKNELPSWISLVSYSPLLTKNYDPIDKISKSMYPYLNFMDGIKWYDVEEKDENGLVRIDRIGKYIDNYCMIDETFSMDELNHITNLTVQPVYQYKYTEDEISDYHNSFRNIIYNDEYSKKLKMMINSNFMIIRLEQGREYSLFDALMRRVPVILLSDKYEFDEDSDFMGLPQYGVKIIKDLKEINKELIDSLHEIDHDSVYNYCIKYNEVAFNFAVHQIIQYLAHTNYREEYRNNE